MRQLLLLCVVLLWLTRLASAESGTHFLLASSEGVELQRDGWPRQWVPVSSGTILGSHDLLRVKGQATVLCADSSVETLSRGVKRNPCPLDNPPTLIWLGAKYRSRQRRTPSQNIPYPYILYPRKTLVLDSRPLLRWHDTGASSYTVAIIQGDGTEVWKGSATGSKLPYPADARSLQSNITYLLLVSDNDTGVTSSQEAKGIGFQLLTNEGLATLETKLEKIQGLSSLDASARQLAIGMYYASAKDISQGGFRPLGAAQRVLEDLAQKQDTPATHLRLGEVLIEMKLENEATAAYRAALKRAGMLGDWDSQATAHAALWWLTGSESHVNEAIRLYKGLGDTAKADALKAERAQ